MLPAVFRETNSDYSQGKLGKSMPSKALFAKGCKTILNLARQRTPYYRQEP